MRHAATVSRAMGLGVLTAAGLALPSLSAFASTITLPGSGSMQWTAQFLGNAGGNTQTTPTGSYGNNYALGLPGQYTFTDTFTSPQSHPLVDSSNTPFENSGHPVGTYDFQDTYEFSLSGPASGDALVVSLNLGPGFGSLFNISDLQFRLYEVPSPVPSPGLTIPGGSTVITAWNGITGNDNGNAISANFGNVQSGTYFLDIAGTADGTSGGTYVGQLNLNPVPLPAALPLLLSGVLGLGGLGALGRQRRRG